MAAVVAVDLIFLLVARVGPIGKFAFLDSPEVFVEFRVTDQAA
jgi:ABC-type tungstate transport system substrate-binding protein